jgi:hypothetical protein
LTLPKALPVRPKTPAKGAAVPKTPIRGFAEKIPVRSPKSPAAASKLPRLSARPKVSQSKVPPKPDGVVLSDAPSESYDSDASSEFEEHPRVIDIDPVQTQREEGAATKSGSDALEGCRLTV